jgi:CHAD domain-containing protein
MCALKSEENVHDAIQLVVERSTRASLALLTDGKSSTLTDEAIHDLRKRVKGLRSLLRLVRADMGDRRFRRANRGLREANLPLSGVRDAKVVLTSCNRLVGRFNALDVARMRLRKALERRLEEARVRVAASPRTRRIVAGKLRTAERVVSDWRASQGSWKNLSHGLRSMYAKGRDASSAVTDVLATDSVGIRRVHAAVIGRKLITLPVAVLLGQAVRRMLSGKAIAPLLTRRPVPAEV